MSIQTIPFPGDAPVPIALATIHNGLVYISGHVGFKPGTFEPISDDIQGQTRETLRQIDEVLTKAGTSRDKLLMVRVYLTHAKRDFAAMNEIYKAWIGDHRSARTTVGVELAAEGLLIEIDAVAAIE